MVDEAIVLAGGLGTRLREVTGELPKPLVPVAGRPFITRILDALVDARLRRVVLATGYRGQQIKTALGANWRGMELTYSQETHPLGTGGAMALASGQLHSDPCLVLNGDTWLGLDYQTFAERLRVSGSRLGVALARVEDMARYGAAKLSPCGDLAGFAGKGCQGRGLVNAGVYCMHHSVLTQIPSGQPASFEDDVLAPLVRSEPVMAYQDTWDFIDIGVPHDYHRAQAFFVDKQA